MTTSTLVTRTLQRFEDRALLTVETQTSSANNFNPDIGPFGAKAVRRFVGTVAEDGKRLTFELADAQESMKLICEMGTVKVAPASAVRRPSKPPGCNGDRGGWLPSTTKAVEALRCGIFPAPDPRDQVDRLEDMAFAAAPGVEFLYVNDDCVMQGGGYRFIPPDGSVRAIRPPGMFQP